MNKQQTKLLMILSIVLASLTSVIIPSTISLEAIYLSLCNLFSAQLSALQVLAAGAGLRLLSFILISLIVVIIKARDFLRKRRESFRLFEKCNISSVGNEHLLIGNAPDFFARDDTLKVVDDHHKRLGPSFGLFFGPDPWVMSVDLQLIQRVFITEGAKHADRTDFRLPFMAEFNESVVGVKGDKWRYTRKLLGPSFSHRQMKTDNVFEDIDRVCQLMLDFIDRHKGPVGKDGDNKRSAAIVDVHYGFKKYSLETIFRVAFGREYKQQMEVRKRDKLIDLITDCSYILCGPITFISIMFVTAQRMLGACIGLTSLGTCNRYIHSITSDTLKRRRELLRERDGKLARHERKMIDSLIESYSQGKLNDTNLKANLFFILLAGYETTSSALTMMTYYLAHHPQIQEKLRRSIVAEGEESQYLDWCIKETIRLWPPVPTSIGRVLEQDFEHKGQLFKKGMSVNASVWSIHRWPEYWGDDVESFRPERFGEPHENELVNSLRYFGFGGGPRNCIGKSLALAEIKAIMSRLLIRYRISTCSSTPDHIDGISPNMIHTIIRHPIDLAFTEITSI